VRLHWDRDRAIAWRIVDGQVEKFDAILRADHRGVIALNRSRDNPRNQEQDNG
jgi:hypothetical protein